LAAVSKSAGEWAQSSSEYLAYGSGGSIGAWNGGIGTWKNGMGGAAQQGISTSGVISSALWIIGQRMKD